jgi:16S rRNA (adenine1518-N6/adenine1519-N6)-dimethyltransferase
MSDLPPAKKSLGQHWLNDETTLSDICLAGELTKNDTVLEIGPGHGTLTKHLTAQAKHVVAVEFDEALAFRLKLAKIAENLTIINEDILTFNLTTLPEKYKVVANIPYYLTSKLVRILSESNNPPELVVLLIQKEVAERLAAEAGDMSLLSVTAQYFWDVSLDIKVPAKMFTPPPKVDSQVVVMRRKNPKDINVAASKTLFRIVKAGFSSRRKTLTNSLSGGLRLDKVATKQLLDAANIDGGLRAQALTMEDWQNLATEVAKLEA